MTAAVLGKAGRLTWSQLNTILKKEHRVTAASMAPEKTPFSTVACTFTTFLIRGILGPLSTSVTLLPPGHCCSHSGQPHTEHRATFPEWKSGV